MRAKLLLRERIDYPDGALIEMKIWQVPTPVPPKTHGLKYSLVHIVGGQRVVGYDNERGKGDHRHIGKAETAYRFTSAARLIEIFEQTCWRQGDRRISGMSYCGISTPIPHTPYAPSPSPATLDGTISASKVAALVSVGLVEKDGRTLRVDYAEIRSVIAV